MDDAGGVWAAYKKRLLAAPRVHDWQCNSPRLAGVLDFSRALPPTHRMPARPRSGVTGMGELPIVAEFEPNTCELLRKHGCERVEGGAEDTPDGWLLDAIEVALAGCNAEGADKCFAMDVGSNLGLIWRFVLCSTSHSRVQQVRRPCRIPTLGSCRDHGPRRCYAGSVDRRLSLRQNLSN